MTAPTTQLRTNIAALFKQLRDNPRLVYKVTSRNEVVAELRVPQVVTPEGLLRQGATSRVPTRP